MSNVAVRYAPSPTGVPHIGNIRTALFNFLFARSQKGRFYLRIEDTDRQRFVPQSIAQIEKSLKVLGLNWDGAAIYQSKRLNIYKKNLALLQKKNLVYQKDEAWYFKVAKNQKISWLDNLHGRIEFNSDVLDDFVIVKSDGFPTYHFASVVDDQAMQITHVIRGDEWISSTPKHLLLYRAFSWQPPEFVHLPPILGSDKKKLSKREGAKSTLEYIDDGYLPEAIVNFLALLGWSPKGDRELFTLGELIGEFSLDRLNKNSPIFNLEKLNWFNKKYLQKYPPVSLTDKIKKYSTHAKTIDDKRLTSIVNLVKDRLTTLGDFDKFASIFFEKGPLASPAKEKIEDAKNAIISVKNWDEKSISLTLDDWIEKNKLDTADFKNTLRLAVFADNSPPIYQSLAVLTKDQALARLDEALKK